MMTSELAKTSTAILAHSFDEALSMAERLAKARGFVPKALLGNPEGVLAAILTGGELGIGPMEALRSIYIVEGKPTLSSDLMLKLALQGGVRCTWLDSSAQLARMRLKRQGHDPHEQSFSVAEAKSAGLLNKDNWRKYPAAMLRARCLSHGLRAYCPDVLGSGVYAEGELDTAFADALSAPAPGREDDIVNPPAEEVPTSPTSLKGCSSSAELKVWVTRFGAKCERAGRMAPVYAHAASLAVERVEVDDWIEATL